MLSSSWRRRHIPHGLLLLLFLHLLQEEEEAALNVVVL